MTFLDTRRTSKSFNDKLSAKPKNTQISYKSSLNNLDSFCKQLFNRSKEDVIDEFQRVDKYVVFGTLQKWIDWNSTNGIKASSIITRFSNINTYFYYKGLELSNRDIKENLDFPKAEEEELYGVQPEDIQKILKVANHAYRCIILAQKSTLMREGELLSIRKKHLVLGKKRILIKIPASFTKLKKARTVILDKEASKPIMSKLKKLDDEDLVWCKKDSSVPTKNYENALRRYCEKTGLDEKYESNGRNKITTHSFRAFGITKISRHDENFAKMLAGQKGYLLQYDRLSDNEKLDLYMKFEADLIVDDSVRKQAELEKSKKENSKLQEKIHENSNLKSEVDDLRDVVNDLKKHMYQERTKKLKKE